MPVNTKSLMLSLNATTAFKKDSQSSRLANPAPRVNTPLEDEAPDRAQQLKMCLTRLEDKDLTPLS